MRYSSLPMTTLPAPGSTDVLYLIDLSGYVFRAYHAITPLSSPSGEPSHATYGTVSMLNRLVDDQNPILLAVAMDSRGPSFRKEIDPTYKANRPPPPEDLVGTNDARSKHRRDHGHACLATGRRRGGRLDRLGGAPCGWLWASSGDRKRGQGSDPSLWDRKC